MLAISDSLTSWESYFAIGKSSSCEIVLRLSLGFIKISSSILEIKPTDLLLSNDVSEFDKFCNEIPRLDNFLVSTSTKISSLASPWISTSSVDPRYASFLFNCSANLDISIKGASPVPLHWIE